jgi:hypothetical protein
VLSGPALPEFSECCPTTFFHQRIAGRYWIESALSSGEPSVLEIGEPAMTGNQTRRRGNSGQIVAPTMFGSLFVRHETHFRQHPEFKEIDKAGSACLNQISRRLRTILCAGRSFRPDC